MLWQRGRDTAVYLRQGGRAGSAAYALIVRRESLGLFRFWLDPSQPHEIADLWGYFRVQPWGSEASLLTYGALVRLDFGVVKLLFSETIRRVALGTPAVVAGAYVEARSRAHRAPPDIPPAAEGSTRYSEGSFSRSQEVLMRALVLSSAFAVAVVVG